MTLQLWGALAFGTIIGWYVYYINRYRSDDISLNDITALVGAIGGGAVTRLFDPSGAQFAAYGVGLAAGFFGYFIVLTVLVYRSDNFDRDWFLDGRRKRPEPPFVIPEGTRLTYAPMAPAIESDEDFHGRNPADASHPPVTTLEIRHLVDPAEPALLPHEMPHAEHYFCSTLEAPLSKKSEALQVRGRAALLNSKHWGQKRLLTVGFIGGSQAVRKRVAEIATGWTQTGAELEFDFWTGADVDPSSADIRVSFVQNGRSWSHLGTDARNIPRDQPTMNLGWLTEDLPEARAQAVVLHEFGHALGLIHEHQNPHDKVKWNVDQVMRDLSGPPNNWDPKTIKRNMFRRYEKGDLFATDVDPSSIMMYPIPQNWTLDNFEVGFNTGLSDDDVRLIEAAYKKLPG